MQTLIWLLFLSIYFAYSASQSTSKPVITYLSAKWPLTSFMLETCEYLAEESPLLFWAFVDEINNKDLHSYEQKSEKEKFSRIVEAATSFLSPSQILLLKFSLSLHIYSPKIESFRQIAFDRGINEKDCTAVAEVMGSLICNPSQVKDHLKRSNGESNSLVFDLDHVYSGEPNKTVVILYGELGTPEMQDFHNILKELSNSGEIIYILRPYVKNPNARKLRMSGFGVELQIKSTEYKAQDDTKLQEDQRRTEGGGDEMVEEEVEGFDFRKLKSIHQDSIESLNKLKTHMLESSHELAPLKVWQLQHLSMQAATRIMSFTNVNDRMSAFIHTAQNFPSLARSLIRTKVDDKLKKEILKNQNSFRNRLDLSTQDGILAINGMQYDLDSVDIFTLLDHLKNEQRVMERLFNLGISGDNLAKLLSLDLSETKVQYGIDIRDSAVNWLNDIEKDKVYSRWPSSISEFLRPAFPGMLRSIRKNIHNIIFVVDPTSRDVLDLLKLVDTFLSHESPIRFGVVWKIVSTKETTAFDDAGVALLNAFNFVVQSVDDTEKANYKGFKFILDFHAKFKQDKIVSKDVIEFFKSRYKNEDTDDIFGFDSEFDFGRQLSQLFIEKGGFRTFPQILMNGVPQSSKQLSTDEFEELILLEVMKNTQNIQRATFNGELSDRHDSVDWLMSQANIMPRINDRILGLKLSSFIDMSSKIENEPSFPSEKDFASLSASMMTSTISHSCRYVAFRNDAAFRPLSVWVVADLEKEMGRSYLLEALKYTKESNEIRICAISNNQAPGIISKIVEVSLASLPVPTVRNFLIKILEKDNAQSILDGSKTWKDFTVNGLDEDAFKSRLENFNEGVLRSKALYSSKVLGIPNGKSSVVANGRMLGVFLDHETFTEDEFSLLEKFMSTTIGKKVTQVLQDHISQSGSDPSDLHMKATSVLMSKPQTKYRTDIDIKSDLFSVVKLPANDPDSPAFDILAICDPVSSAAQKIGPLVKTLHDVLNANVRIFLNAAEKHSEMPLKSFYRYVLESEPQFTENGDLTLGPYAKFTGLSESTIYTQNYDTPDNWLVEAVKSIHDLDNIKLEHVETVVHSEFELEYLLLEGHCYEQTTGNPPRGLQFTLGTRQQPVKVDTIVMANLGYFQLKANPGAMILRLREGRSSDIYNIVSHEGTESPPESDDIMVLMNSFRSHVIKVKVAKKPGMADQDLLQEDSEESGGGIWNAISSTFSQSEKEETFEDEYINIFSVASGHLYERFLRIMMVSVRRHSSKPVKFWLIKNFLSPTFKDSLAILADKFGFEYELVQYKWPRWLHQQKEKQRIIWGYKILFLDVLFPLHVKKIIFVDADQVVRADMNELQNLNLGGAPYGFVPFCDSRKEMEGFRFWKQGYWRSHLGGRKYHISALFVVDLKKFRLIAAGDRLRGQYQGLSQDPNSLSNLDQDLPNNMVHQVKIKSLPQEWLWCETWCDDESKSQAKVIDLCNNPMTKEAKLTAAQRIISEWTDLDESIKEVLKGRGSSRVDDPRKETTPPPHSEL